MNMVAGNHVVKHVHPVTFGHFIKMTQVEVTVFGETKQEFPVMAPVCYMVASIAQP
jgi:hypothetical protein